MNGVPPPPPTSDPPPPPPEEIERAPPPPSDGPATTNGHAAASNAPKAAAPKKQPLSIEEILRKKKEADEAAAKVGRSTIAGALIRGLCACVARKWKTDNCQPKFMTKAQREKAALEKRQKEFEEQKRNKAAEQAPSTNGTRGPSESRANERATTSHHQQNGDSRPSSAIPTGPRALRRNEPPAGPSSMRSHHQAQHHNQNHHQPNGDMDMAPPPPPKATAITGPGNSKPPPANEMEAAAAELRKRYMGSETASTFSASKKRKRTTEKKFNFEWNAEEDTSTDYNPLYQTRMQANLFGRGHLAGYAEDSSDASAAKYAKALEERDGVGGRARAQELLEMERRRREEGGRNFLDKHWSEKPLTAMKERDWRIFKEDFNISTKGGSIPNPMRNWGESNLPKRLMDVIERVGYTEPSAVQRAAIPIAMQSRDLIGVAVTGSGKTAAFLLPLLVYISELPPLNDFTKNDGPYAVILAPTRELAQQIEIEAKKFATPLGFTCVSIVGGHSIEEQSFNMREGAEIIIATPGRLVDCIERRVLVLGQCCYVIMDEADRMIDLGFEEPVNKILDALPVTNEKPDDESAENPQAMSQHLGGKDRYRQTMMYTATMPAAVERIARKYLRRPAIVTIGNIGEAVDTVEQRVEFVSGEEKRKKRLQELLSQRDTFPPPIIVFVNIKRNCDAVARDIRHMGFGAVTLHGSKTQEQREAALLSVRKGETDVLVATDLAGRGIDVPDVSLVVNFNMATNIESYTHRIGRTGRAGKQGISVTFLGPEDNDVLYDLKQMLSKSPLSRLPDELRRHEAAQQKGGKRGEKPLEGR